MAILTSPSFTKHDSIMVKSINHQSEWQLRNIKYEQRFITAKVLLSIVLDGNSSIIIVSTIRQRKSLIQMLDS